VKDVESLRGEFGRMMRIDNVTGILLQPYLSGREIFIGAKKDGGFGTVVMCGLGGIFVEALGDVVSAMAPFSPTFAGEMIKKLRGYKIIRGIRGEEGINEVIFAEMVSRVATLCHYAPEIVEMDINPLLGNSVNLTAVDARIRIKRND
jgi:acetyltransferase